MTDPITDMLNRIRNAQAVAKTEVLMPFSKFKNEIATTLNKEGFLIDVKRVAKGRLKLLKIVLKYNSGVPAIEGMKRVSKPGQRIYIKSDEIRKVRGGFGVSIISTPKGLMTNDQARKSKLGGEVLLEIW